MVHGILAARLDAVPEAIECADGPPPLLAASSSPPGTMNRGGMQANAAEALHRETTVGTSREGHRGLALFLHRCARIKPSSIRILYTSLARTGAQ